MRTWVIHETDESARMIWEIELTEGITLNYARALYSWRYDATEYISVEGIVLRSGLFEGPLPEDVGELREVREIGGDI